MNSMGEIVVGSLSSGNYHGRLSQRGKYHGNLTLIGSGYSLPFLLIYVAPSLPNNLLLIRLIRRPLRPATPQSFVKIAPRL